MARAAQRSASVRLTTRSSDRRRVVRGGFIALAIGWLAWFSWFSRAALLAIGTVAAVFALFVGVRSIYRMIRAGRDFHRAICLRLLLMLARRIA